MPNIAQELKQGEVYSIFNMEGEIQPRRAIYYGTTTLPEIGELHVFAYPDEENTRNIILINIPVEGYEKNGNQIIVLDKFYKNSTHQSEHHFVRTLLKACLEAKL